MKKSGISDSSVSSGMALLGKEGIKDISCNNFVFSDSFKYRNRKKEEDFVIVPIKSGYSNNAGF